MISRVPSLTGAGTKQIQFSVPQANTQIEQLGHLSEQLLLSARASEPWPRVMPFC